MGNKKEIWKKITVRGKKPSVPYMISNLGRFGVKKNGEVEVRKLKPSGGSYRYNIRHRGKNVAIFLHREVAKAFLKKPSAKQTLVIHKDHNYLNNQADNLKWASVSKHHHHTSKSPRALQARKHRAITASTRSKVISEKQVIALKKMMWDPRRKLSFSQLAKKFGVSEMQIYRIKKGEFWYHIRVPNEPEHDKFKINQRNILFHEKKNSKAGGKRK